MGRVQSAPDSFGATRQTVEVMCQQIRDSARDPMVQRAALNCARAFRGGPLYIGRDPLHDPAALAESCWWWAKHYIRFVHHEALIRQWLNEANQLQLLISPDVLVRMEDRKGDCAIFTSLVCAFLSCLGVDWEIVTVAANPAEPGVFSHVYARAVLPGFLRLALDASHGKYPGWQVPQAHSTRTQVWDMQGRPVEDRDSRWSGLHSYHGLGDDSTTLNDPFGVYSTDTSAGRESVDVNTYNPTPGSAAPGFNWGNFLGNLANQWTQIGGRVIAPTTTIQRGPNGQLMISTPAGSPAGSALVSASAGAGAALPSSLVWIAGGVVVAMVLASALAKK
jgi:hypothetical protein